jgi:hypothetical protein
MQTFSRRVVIEPGFKPEFHFTKIYCTKGMRFHVSVSNGYQSYAFNIEFKHPAWKIINAPEVPSWIMNAEKQLEEIILENVED